MIKGLGKGSLIKKETIILSETPFRLIDSFKTTKHNGYPHRYRLLTNDETDEKNKPNKIELDEETKEQIWEYIKERLIELLKNS